VSRTIRSDTLNKDFIYTVAAVRTEMDENIEDFRLTIVLTILGLGLVLIGTVWLQVRFGLGPLRRIPKALAAIRSGENDRLTGSFSAEVEPLAREINALLDHNAEVVERARTHVGNLAHALKTPLAVLTNEASGREGPLADSVKAQLAIMQQQVDHHLSRARMAARAGVLGARTSVMPVLEGLARTLEKIHRARAISVSLEGPPEIAFRGERQDLEEMLGNLLDNACKYAKARVSAKAMEGEGGRLVIEIADDGPGVPSEHRRVAQKRGVRLDEKGQGSGLGLSIVNDIAEIYGGGFTMDEAKLGGLRVVLDLPLAGAPTSRRLR
jgi:signal transduction histidine kinase